MPITVDAPDGSQVEFPDSMQPEEIEGVLSKQFPNKDKERKSLQDEMSKLRFQGFLGEQEQAALGAAENIAKVAAIPATPILKLPRSQDPGVTGGLLNVGAGLAEGLSAPAYWMLPGSKPLQALTAGQIAGNIPEATVNAVQTLTNPQATTAQKVEAGAAPLLEAGTAGLLSGAVILPRRAAPESFPEAPDPREVARQATLPSQEPFAPAPKVPEVPKVEEPIPKETPPVVPQGETPAEAPAVSEAVQEGVAAPPEEPAITETTTEPKVAQVPTVTPEVTEEPPVAKAADQVQNVARTEGKRPAKEVKSELMSRIDDAIKNVEKSEGGFIEINIPGDGDFKVGNNLKELSEIRDRVKSISTTKGTPPKLPKGSSAPEAFKLGDEEGNYSAQDVAKAESQQAKYLKALSGIKDTEPLERYFYDKNVNRDLGKDRLHPNVERLSRAISRIGSVTVGQAKGWLEARVRQAKRLAEEQQGKPISEGPGAASPGDVPEGSQLSQLTQTIQRQISPQEPLIDRIKAAVNVADKWAKTKDSATQGIAKARAASQALIDGYLHLPPWRDFEESVGKWTGADQETALQVRQFQKQIVKAIPSRLRQEAITNWIQADGDEAVLRERAAASKPSVRKGYELALQLNEGEKTLARNVSQYLDARLKEGLANGLLKQGVDNYVTQIWKRPTSATQKLWADLFGTGALNPNFKYARRRIFESYFEGEQAGYIPKNKTIGNLISQYDLAFNRALSARALIKQLQEGKAGDGMPITMTSGKTTPVGNPEEIPEAYLIKPNQPPTGAVSGDGRPYRPIDHWALRDWKWATKGPQGQNVFVQGDMLVHPDYYTRLNNALKTSRLRQPEGIGMVTGPLLRGAAVLKQTKLSLSPFHTVQEGVHAMAHRVNPFAPGEIDLADPIQKGLVDHGLMVQDPRAHELFAEGSSGGGLIGKIPGLGRLQEAYTDLTFRDYIPKLKMEMAKDAFDRNMKAYSKQLASGKVTADQIMALTARESNAAFGEQNYKMMGRSPNVQDVWRLTLLAPDFLESRFRFVAQALKPYGREQRIALGLMFATLYTAARVINKAADDNYHWDKPFSVFINGREYRLRTVLGDVQHLITDQRSFWYNRLSPVSRTVTEYLFSRDDRGIKRSSAEQFVDFLSWFKPIPTQIRSDQTLGQAALAATGIPSKSYTKAQQVYELVDNWMKNSKDPKVQERYQRLRQETLPDSPYRPLRDALKRDDLKAAKTEYLKLRQSRNDSVISEAMRQNRPFTGSLQSENKFKASLSEEQKRLYDQAIQERKDTYQKFLRAKGVK